MVQLTGEETPTSLLSTNQSPPSTSSLASTEGQELTTGPAELTTGPAELTTGPAELTTGSAELTTGSEKLTPWQLIKESLAGPTANNLSNEERQSRALRLKQKLEAQREHKRKVQEWEQGQPEWLKRHLEEDAQERKGETQEQREQRERERSVQMQAEWELWAKQNLQEESRKASE